MELNIKLPQVSWNQETQTFSAYLSDLGWGVWGNLCAMHQPLYVWNPETGKKIRIDWESDDKDGSNEDTYGYNYKGYNPAKKRHFKFLFINT